ncbi:beta-ketoacyl-ACP synthase III [Streptomyces sp. BK208]|uniref:beta-ketoacyl-ACP synthase III n=1 Tax=Streptomyces sp. BK208 TaxID=2512150 RepID=UPI0032665861
MLSGIGSWLPPRIVTNDELAQRHDTSDHWIRTRTGIVARHIVSPGMPTSHLAEQAGARALQSAGTRDIDAVLLATTTPDRLCPASAPKVAHALGLGGRPAFDLDAVCSGFLYALSTAASIIVSEAADRVLVIAAEAFSTLINPSDRSSAVVFGDGAGAVVLRAGTPDEPGAIGRSVLGSDGSLADLITVLAGGSEQPHATSPDGHDDNRYFSMRGRAVFHHAVNRMSEATRASLAHTGWAAEDVDRIVAHQANLRLLHSVAEQLNIAPERLVVHLDRVGNTAAASIPLALEHANRSGALVPGHRVVLTAFGGGATWGATTLIWPSLTCA